MSLASQFPLFAVSAWEPPVDVYRSERGWLVKVELAGVRPDEVEVERVEGAVRICGRRADVLVDSSWRRERIEIAYSRFERVIRLPIPGDVRFETEYRDGMLLVFVWCC